MSRLHLSLIFAFLSGSLHAQNELGKYLKFADEQVLKGDYVYALTYYEKALELDSNTVTILWKYAEALKAYKNYPKAAFYYQKVYEKEETTIHPSSLLNWGLMEKQCGNYEKAIDVFKRAKKKYAKDKKSYNYIKSKRELESCIWALSASKNEEKLLPIKLPDGLNTVNSEFGHTITNNVFIISSLRADSINNLEEIYDATYTNQLYQFPWNDSIQKAQAEKIKALNVAGINTGNGSFSKDGKRFYFSQCENNLTQFNCKIAVSNYANGKWSAPELAGKIINEPGANTTTPHITEINGQEWLIFSSDKPDGKGGMDLYFSILKNNGNQFSKVKSFPVGNSADNEIAPWFDTLNKTFYFSSSWWNGFGGYDVHYSNLIGSDFSPIQNMGIPLNSAANDLYFFKAGDSTFLSSNRLGVLYAKNPTCCSDIFGFTTPIIEQPISKKETLEDLNKRLPVTLYFHNDTPDPRSKETGTKVNYLDAYSAYIDLIPQYKKEYASGLNDQKASDAEEDIESFFIEYVEKGVADLELFQELLLEELAKGRRIRMNVKGFASPLAKTDYNVALTQRRINSLINHLKQFKQGVFIPYLSNSALNGGQLEVVAVPFGEYTADQVTSDNPNDVKNSVFSRAAARERKIEIQSVSYLDTDSLFYLVEIEPTSIILGKQTVSVPLYSSFKLLNTSESPLIISKIIAKDTLFSAQFESVLTPGRTQIVRIQSNGNLPLGIFSIPLDVYFNNFEKPVRVMVLGEGIE